MLIWQITEKRGFIKKILSFTKDEEQLSQFIKAACKEAKTPDGIEMQYGQVLRLGSKYNFSKIDKNNILIYRVFLKSYKRHKYKK